MVRAFLRPPAAEAARPTREGRPTRSAPQLLHSGPFKIVTGPGSGLGKKPARSVKCASVQMGVRGGQGPVDVPLRRGGQLDGALQEGGHGGRASSGLSPTRHSFEFNGNLLVWPGCRRREMPYPALRVDLCISGCGQRQVGGAAILGRRGPIGRGANQRMAKAHPGVDLE